MSRFSPPELTMAAGTLRTERALRGARASRVPFLASSPKTSTVPAQPPLGKEWRYARAWSRPRDAADSTRDACAPQRADLLPQRGNAHSPGLLGTSYPGDHATMVLAQRASGLAIRDDHASRAQGGSPPPARDSSTPLRSAQNDTVARVFHTRPLARWARNLSLAGTQGSSSDSQPWAGGRSPVGAKTARRQEPSRARPRTFLRRSMLDVRSSMFSLPPSALLTSSLILHP
jgi:hypothetical protein